MFKLPGDPPSIDKIQTFASYVLNCTSKGNRESSSSLIQRKGSFCWNSDKRNSRNKLRPQTSQLRKSGSKQSSDMNRFSFNGTDVLISPSNRNFKYFISEPRMNNIDCKLANSNFLLQPCKIESIPIKPRKELLKQSPFDNSKYSSPFGVKLKFSPERTSSAMVRNKSARQPPKSKPMKPQQLIEPWQISDCHFESIKLNQKNS